MLFWVVSSCFDAAFLLFSSALWGLAQCKVGVNPPAGGAEQIWSAPVVWMCWSGRWSGDDGASGHSGDNRGASDWWARQVQCSICHCRTHCEHGEERWMAGVGLRLSVYVKWMDERAEGLFSGLTPWRGPFPHVCSGVCLVNWPQSKTTPESSCSNLCLLFIARLVGLDTGNHIHFIFIGVWRSTAWSTEFTSAELLDASLWN